MAERHTARGWWLEQEGPVDPAGSVPPQGTKADVVIVGGGYTGMWSAWHLKQLEPDADVVICESGVCGDGPSGRNGGFVNDLWLGLPRMREQFGDEPALALARAAQQTVTAVGEFCAEQEIDAWFRRGGYMRASTTPFHDESWGEDVVTACRELGEPGACVRLTADEVRSRCGAPVFRGGLLFPAGASVNPARLARGLRRRLLESGVRIFEDAEVTNVEPMPGSAPAGVVARTSRGDIRARGAILAAGPRLLGMKPLRRRLTLTSSHMVMTEPVPDVLEDLGWTGGEAISDMRTMLHYMRTTPDGRIAFGWGGGRVVYGSRPRRTAEVDPRAAAQVERDLLRFFPQLKGRRIEAAWGGPVDVSPTHLPVAGTVPGSPVHYAFGYTGNGVGPTHLVGRALASLALDRRDEHSRLAFVDPPHTSVPPEPFRFAGGVVIRKALLRKEAAEERGDRPGRLSTFIAGIPARLGIHIGR